MINLEGEAAKAFDKKALENEKKANKKLNKKEILTECLLHDAECNCEKCKKEEGVNAVLVSGFLPEEYIKYSVNIIKKHLPSIDLEKMEIVDDFMENQLLINEEKEYLAILSTPNFIRGKKLKKEYLHKYKLLFSIPIKQYTPTGTNIAYNVTIFLYKKLEEQL